MKNIIVVYHANCLDGLASAYSAWLKFKDEAEYIPMQYGEKIDFEIEDKEIYILDFSFSYLDMLYIVNRAKSVLIIDHHETTAKTLLKHFPDNLLYNVSKSGCVLSWEYFLLNQPIPLLLQHIQDNDIWAYKMQYTKEIITFLYQKLIVGHQLQNNDYQQFIAFDFYCKNSHVYGEFLQKVIFEPGKLLYDTFLSDVNSLVKQRHLCLLKNKQTGDILKTWAVNAPDKYASEVGNQLAKLSGTFGVVYHINGKLNLKVSLRSEGDYNVAEIAEAFGGGGHKNSAAFINDDYFSFLIGNETDSHYNLVFQQTEV